MHFHQVAFVPPAESSHLAIYSQTLDTSSSPRPAQVTTGALSPSHFKLEHEGRGNGCALSSPPLLLASLSPHMLTGTGKNVDDGVKVTLSSAARYFTSSKLSSWIRKMGMILPNLFDGWGKKKELRNVKLLSTQGRVKLKV